jgi:predicted ATP-dependent protease
MREALRELDQGTAEAEVTWRVEELAQSYSDLPAVAEHLRALGRDIVSHLDEFMPAEPPPGTDSDASFRPPTYDAATRYAVNVMVDYASDAGAPVVEEAHPTVPNLLGRIEYRQAYGMVSTDFTMLRPGALHRANGGYLLLEATDVLQEPHSWESFKRALRTGTIRFEPLQDGPGNVFTELPEPDAIPLDCRVVLMGDVDLYHHLYDVDPDFAELFKVKAEFADTMKRDGAGELGYARFVAKVAREEELLPFTADAVARVVDFGAREAEDASRLTTRLVDVADVLREADYWARKDGSARVEGSHLEHAVEQRIRRADLAREMAQESFLRDVVRVPTEGRLVGQLNALTVFDVGDCEFGTPVRVTARVHLGGGEVVDIEREVELGGPMHSKGVLILGGYITGRYLPDEPLAMAASLTFEQSGGYIDGDSASLAEVLALLSAISGLEIEQGIAVTGSVNQAGDVQAIGAVNEKVEGFFDLCAARGLRGQQGVIIPADNAQHLMLRRDVVEAAAGGRFHIFAVRNVDEGFELLTGLPAGESGPDGSFPEGTANRAVDDRLRRLAERRKQHPDDADDDQE